MRVSQKFPALENPVVDEREVTTRKALPNAAHTRTARCLPLALNYADHASELEFKPPEEPLVFPESAEYPHGR